LAGRRAQTLDASFRFGSAAVLERLQQGTATAQAEHLDQELYCLALYLRALSSARLLDYPLSIKAAEDSKSPDFLVTSAGKTIGIEVTRATSPEFQRMMTKHQKHFEDTRRTTATPMSMLGWQVLSQRTNGAGWSSKR
jgi:hypothetical protein